ncbi:high mobility group B protein 9-like protein isoform X2 [Cinnamomum micranthum f. kanehirae]|uniref:High mobility group B protein 9-like protein isoform X2 n=1 Tax=Cinnamomum micranthum f. kanehirae TaxID=337451 RepID=A0A3S3MTI7_9MAGN|nr:high mobility group B protein 9-like protein isoform X2 [Cinnamomum micranthum f. kanehirae]
MADEKVYPTPLASNEDIISNPTVFMNALRQFHSTLGTRFMIPVMGGKGLDLHLLYVEVTKRGGLEKVIKEKRWKEVIAAFKFPPTTTSASFVLRKYYTSLLHHFEQVYFFKVQGKLVPPAVTMAVKTPPSCKPAMPCVTESEPDSLLQQLQQLQQMVCKRQRAFPTLESGEPMNLPVMGVINGKFDNGYFVTVTVGLETFQGVLYHVFEDASTSLATPNNAIVPYVAPQPQRRRRRGKRNRDPNHPKPNRSAYNFFFAEKHSKLKLLYPQREREFSKMIGESWSKLTQEERMVSGTV